MDDEVRPAVVGAFVLVLGAVLVAAVLWLAAGFGGRREVDPYQATVQESVAGLDVDAPVKYLGVDVGKVSHIGIDPRNSRQVRLRFLIDHGTPIKQDSLAVLKTQGLTGIAYVELSGGSPDSPALVAGADGEAPMIPFKLSLGARLENVLTNVLAKVDRLSNHLDGLFDADNRAALKALLADAAAVAHAVAARREAIGAGIGDAALTARTAARAAERIAPALDRVAKGAQAVQRMAEDAGAASVRAGRAVDTAASGVTQQLSSETLPELARLMAEVARLSQALRVLGEQTAAQPSSLLLGLPPVVPGPGETGAPPRTRP